MRERAAEIPADAGEEIARLALPEIAFSALQLAACRPDDVHIPRSFFQRSQELAVSARQQLAHRLTTGFLSRTAYQPAPTAVDSRWAEAFLASQYRDLLS